MLSTRDNSGVDSKEKTQEKPEKCEDGEVTDATLVATAIAYLRANPFDYAGCSKHLGLSFYLMRKLRKEFCEEFELEEEHYLSQLEKLVALDALGRELPPGYEGFEFAKAMKVLERRKREWAASQKQLPPEPPKLDLSYREVLKEHIEREFGSTARKSVRPGSA